MAMLVSKPRLSLRILFLLLLSACILPLAFLLLLRLPSVADQLPSVCNVFAPWLRPPYLYIILNCIILSIVASSKLQHGGGGSSDGYARQSVLAPRKVVTAEVSVSFPYAEYRRGYVSKDVEGPVVMVTGQEEEEKVVPAEEVDFEGAAVTDSMMALKRSGSVEFAGLEDSKDEEQQPGIDKQTSFARSGHQRSTKFSPRASKSLNASRTRGHDTLESIWRNITEGRATPLPTRHLKRYDTWREADEDAPPPPPTEGIDSGKLGREQSLGQEELNRRVEAFIRKFNEEMKLQRDPTFNFPDNQFMTQD